MEAIAIRVEAIAIRLEAIAIRVEAIASRLQAIASRLDAIAIRFPLLLGWRPFKDTLSAAMFERPVRDSVARCIGGMRGITCMISETSLLERVGRNPACTSQAHSVK